MSKQKCGSGAFAPRWLALALAFVPAALFAQPPITVEDAWVRAAPPSMPMTAGYLTLQNATRDDVALTGVESAQFARVELHRSTLVDGVARMEAVESAVIPARGELVLEPGGLHLMLMEPQQSLTAGADVVLTLSFDNGWTVEVDVPVR